MKTLILILICVGYLYPQGNTIPRRVDTLETDVDSLYTKTSHIVNVKEFGAVGDSTTNDSAAVYNALYSIRNGGTLIVPKGQYRTEMLFLNGMHDITIQGTGKGSIFENAGNDLAVFKLTNCYNITFDNITIRGDFLTMLTNHDSQGGIWSNNGDGDSTYNVTIKNCYFNNLGGDAITILGNTSNVKILNNTWEDGLGFVQLIAIVAWPVNDILIDGNTILASPQATRPAAPMSGSDDLVDGWGDITNVIITNNYFDARRVKTDTLSNSHGVLFSYTHQVPVYGRTNGVLVENNIFRNFHNSDPTYFNDGAVFIYAEIDNVVIKDNIFYADTGYQINLEYTDSPVIIEGNKFIGGMGGIELYDNLSDTNFTITPLRHLIKNNTFSGFTKNAIFMTNKGAEITGNVFDLSSCTEAGIWVSWGDSVNISNNLFLNGGTAAQNYSKVGIRWTKSGHSQLNNNRFINFQTTGIYINDEPTISDLTLSGNYFRNVTNTVIDAKGDALYLIENNPNREYAERFYVGTDGYLSGDNEEVYVTNKEGKQSKVSSNLSTPIYDLPKETNLARIQADAISKFLGEEQSTPLYEILNPTTNDSLVLFWNDENIIPDSIKIVVDDSTWILGKYGTNGYGNSFLDDTVLITSSATITNFNDATIASGNLCYLYFPQLGDGNVKIVWKFYYKRTEFYIRYLTDTYVDRVTTEGGTVIDSQAVEDFYTNAVTNSYLDSLELVAGTSYGVKFDADSNITKLFDLSLNRKDIVQTDTTYSPQLKLSQINGYATASFDGSDDFMQVQLENLSQPETVFLIAKVRTWVASKYLVDGYDIASAGIVLVGLSPGVELYSGITDCHTALSVGSFDLITAVFDSANSSIQVDNNTMDTGTLYSIASGGITLGSIGGSAQFYENPDNHRIGFSESDLSEQIIVNKHVSNSLKGIIKTFLQTKYSL